MTNRLKGNLLVLGQFILIGLLIFVPSSGISTGAFTFFFATLSIVLLLAGFVILGLSALALGKSLTAHPIPGKDAVLVTDGLYRFVKHPIYSGLLLAALGLTIVGGFFPHALFFVALVFLLNYKASFEEALLTKAYAGYADYSKKTGRFVPRLIR
ncbi:MAG: methyltransferase [Rhodoluna sp.]|jgi:protein-S-isoprenylcysteine O-methyltransferase Ste14